MRLNSETLAWNALYLHARHILQYVLCKRLLIQKVTLRDVLYVRNLMGEPWQMFKIFVYSIVFLGALCSHKYKFFEVILFLHPDLALSP